MWRLVVTFILAVVALAAMTSTAFAGGGGHGGGDPCTRFGAGERLVMRDHCFESTGHVVEAAGSTLTVVNEGRFVHRFAAVDGSFDTGDVAPGEQAELTLDTAGTFEVYCPLHATRDGDGMAGLLVVAGSSLTNVAATPAGTGGDAGTWPWWLVALIVVTAAGALGARRATLHRQTA